MWEGGGGLQHLQDLKHEPPSSGASLEQGVRHSVRAEVLDALPLPAELADVVVDYYGLDVNALAVMHSLRLVDEEENKLDSLQPAVALDAFPNGTVVAAVARSPVESSDSVLRLMDGSTSKLTEIGSTRVMGGVVLAVYAMPNYSVLCGREHDLLVFDASSQLLHYSSSSLGRESEKWPLLWRGNVSQQQGGARVLSFAHCADGWNAGRVISAGYGGWLSVHNMVGSQNGEASHTAQVHGASITAVLVLDVTADSFVVATASTDRTVCLSRVQLSTVEKTTDQARHDSGSPIPPNADHEDGIHLLMELRGHEHYVWDLALQVGLWTTTECMLTLASVSWDRHLRMWHVALARDHSDVVLLRKTESEEQEDCVSGVAWLPSALLTVNYVGQLVSYETSTATPSLQGLAEVLVPGSAHPQQDRVLVRILYLKSVHAVLTLSRKGRVTYYAAV